MSEHASIYPLHEGVDYAFWVKGDFELVRFEVEEPACFDEFESFVSHSGRVDGNFCPHRPVRVLLGFLWSDVL